MCCLQPLKGITIGDIGPHFGSQANDNGYCRFNRVRIPRDQMLMKYSRVSREGVYSKPPHAKLSYGTMVIVRAGLVVGAFSVLARAATISIRYSAVRRQGNSDSEGGETKVLDYRMQQYRLLPLLAAAYGLQFTGRYMLQVFEEMQKGMASGDLSALPEVHATSSGLKSLTTRIAADGIEECRKACGG
jgi:acyl-CoA oxidase